MLHLTSDMATQLWSLLVMRIYGVDAMTALEHVTGCSGLLEVWIITFFNRKHSKEGTMQNGIILIKLLGKKTQFYSVIILKNLKDWFIYLLSSGLSTQISNL